MKLQHGIIIFIFLLALSLVGQTLLETDFGARPVAMGGAYVSILGGPESIFWNPAGMSEPEKADVALGYQYKFGNLSHIQLFGDYKLDLPMWTFLNGYVGFGLVTWWTRLEGWNDINESIGKVGASETLIGLAYKKSFFNLLNAGLSLKYNGSSIDKDTAGAFVMDIGARSEISGVSIGFLIKNIGIGSKKIDIPMGIVVGGNYTVYKTFNNLHKVNVTAQLSSVQGVGFVFNIGAEYAYRNFLFARIGHNGIPELSLGVLSGMRFGFGVKKYGGQFDYVFSSFGDLGPVHDVSISYRLDPFFGFQEDTMPPFVKFKPLGIYFHKYFFSPDNDFIDDSMEAEVLIKDKSGMQEWGYFIQDEKGNKIVEKLHQPLQGRKVFKQNIIWAGKNNKGEVLPEGFYYLKLTTVDVRGNNIDRSYGPIQLTISPIAAIVDIQNNIMSSPVDVFKFVLMKRPKQKYKSWKCQISDTNNIVVKELKGKKRFKNVEWDGRNENGVLLPDGVYNAIFTFTYPNGKLYQDAPIPLQIRIGGSSSSGMPTMTQGTQVVQMNLSATNFSKDLSKFVKIDLIVPVDKKSIARWELIAENDLGIIKLIQDTKYKQKIKWYGDDVNGVPLPDGKYKIKMIVYTVNNLKLDSDYMNVLIDNTYPAVNLDVSSIEFSPDGDGNNDSVSVNIKITENIALQKWTLKITKGKTVIREFSGTDINPSITWDGTDENGKLIVHSGDVYNIQCSAVDTTGNVGESEVKVLKVGILLIKEQNGYRMNVPPIKFTKGNATLLPEAFSILDDVANILNQYSDYKVEIQGYTDNKGNKEKNIALSQQRAEAVRKYMVNVKKMSADRFTAKGYGAENPIADNSTSDGRKLNNRIEFLLYK